MENTTTDVTLNNEIEIERTFFSIVDIEEFEQLKKGEVETVKCQYLIENKINSTSIKPCLCIFGFNIIDGILMFNKFENVDSDDVIRHSTVINVNIEPEHVKKVISDFDLSTANDVTVEQLRDIIIVATRDTLLKLKHLNIDNVDNSNTFAINISIVQILKDGSKDLTKILCLVPLELELDMFKTYQNENNLNNVTIDIKNIISSFNITSALDNTLQELFDKLYDNAAIAAIEVTSSAVINNLTSSFNYDDLIKSFIQKRAEFIKQQEELKNTKQEDLKDMLMVNNNENDTINPIIQSPFLPSNNEEIIE